MCLFWLSEAVLAMQGMVGPLTDPPEGCAAQVFIREISFMCGVEGPHLGFVREMSVC